MVLVTSSGPMRVLVLLVPYGLAISKTKLPVALQCSSRSQQGRGRGTGPGSPDRGNLLGTTAATGNPGLTEGTHSVTVPAAYKPTGQARFRTVRSRPPTAGSFAAETADNAGLTCVSGPGLSTSQ
jgi:hypothetical protein